jgi:hypothetical protein
MSNFLAKLKPADFIALFIIAGGLYLKLRGADGLVGSLLISVAAYYFGKVSTQPKV